MKISRYSLGCKVENGNPLRPKFRNKAQSNIYFLSQRKFTDEKKNQFIKKIKITTFLTVVIVGGYFLTN